MALSSTPKAFEFIILSCRISRCFPIHIHHLGFTWQSLCHAWLNWILPIEDWFFSGYCGLEVGCSCPVTADYLARCRQLIDRVSEQQSQIRTAADWFAQSILAGRMVHVFGSGHSRIMVEEMWPRYGSFPGFNPIVELSLTFHHPVVGANGQRQAMHLENVSGLAERILRNFALSKRDTALIISSSGCNIVPIEMAELFQQRGLRVVAIISMAHGNASSSRRADGKKLKDFADLILDTGAPVGDAMVRVPGLEDTPVSPGSTIGGCLLINALKAEIAARLTAAGQPPKVLTASALVGPDRSAQLFESAYDEHAHRLAKLYERAGTGVID